MLLLASNFSLAPLSSPLQTKCYYIKMLLLASNFSLAPLSSPLQTKCYYIKMLLLASNFSLAPPLLSPPNKMLLH